MSDLHGERRPAVARSERCRFCGHSNPAAAKYCNDCGSPLTLRPCALCGAINGLDAARCHACDAALPYAADATVAGETRNSGTRASPVPVADAQGLPAGVVAASGRVRLLRAWPVLAAAIGLAAVAGYYAYGPAGEREAGSPTAVAPDGGARPAKAPAAEGVPHDGQAPVASDRVAPTAAPEVLALPPSSGAESAAAATAAATTAAAAATGDAPAPSGVEPPAAKRGSASTAAAKRSIGRSTKPPSAEARSKAAPSAKKERPQSAKRAPATKPPRAASAPRARAAKPAAGAGKAPPGPVTEGAAR